MIKNSKSHISSGPGQPIIFEKVPLLYECIYLQYLLSDSFVQCDQCPDGGSDQDPTIASVEG